MNTKKVMLFIDIKNKVHDASGVDKPFMYYWELTNGVWYPTNRISEDEFHQDVRDFIEENNLPNLSLDEIPLSKFNKSQLEMRDFFMSIFDNF